MSNPQAVKTAISYFNDPQFRLAVVPEHNYEQGKFEGWVPSNWSYPRWVWENAYSIAREEISHFEEVGPYGCVF